MIKANDLTKKECKLAAQLWIASLAQNHEPPLDPENETHTAISNYIFEEADKLQGGHPKFGSIADIVNYIIKNRPSQ